jgi:hypothetical protein
MAPFVIVEHLPPLCSASSSSSTLFHSNKTDKDHCKSQSQRSCERTTATIVSLEESSYDQLIQETVEVIHKHGSESARPTTVITTSSAFFVMSLQLDRYGFIVNIDSKGQVFETNGDESIRVPTFAEAQRTERREQKWNDALKSWDPKKKHQLEQRAKQQHLPNTTNTNFSAWRPAPPQLSPSLAAAPLPSKIILRRLRKGIPDSVRGKVWMALGGGIQKPGLYQEIVHETSDAILETYREIKERRINSFSDPLSVTNGDASSEYPIQEETNSNRTSPTSASTDVSSTPPGASRKRKIKKPLPTNTNEDGKKSENLTATRNFRIIQDIIERDIPRTFPRHNLFFEDERHNGAESINSQLSLSPTNLMSRGLCDPELAALILNLETDIRMATSGETSGPVNNFGARGGGIASNTPGGQAALRRVLRAYSYYDPEVGYCQGMNFIAGMFLTVMAEEEAFWMLVGQLQFQSQPNLLALFNET